VAWTVSSTSNIKTNFNNVGHSPAYEWPLDLLYCILRPLLAHLIRYPVFLHSFYLLTLDDEPPAVPYRRSLPRVNQCRGTCFRDSSNPTSSTPTPFSPSHTSRESPTNPCRPYNKHRHMLLPTPTVSRLHDFFRRLRHRQSLMPPVATAATPTTWGFTMSSVRSCASSLTRTSSSFCRSYVIL
jgi:hypothetical protein